ncbi:MAG: type I methionyl aminopeptidase [Puniceicoccales bacterium]|jgi:methionyl aminopeptidase|nr:type I methionyl aminopeptidase [Puniceicoccales bacterium]
MIPVKTSAEISVMRDACRMAAQVLEEMAQRVAPGVSTLELDEYAKGIIDKFGAESACFRYKMGRHVFPAYTCISVNEEVIHGIPSKERVIRPSDIVSLDVVLRYNGFVGDNARTVFVGTVPPEVQSLCEVAEKALYAGIAQARSGNRVGDISHAIEQFIRPHHYGIIESFVGHGVGRSMHEDPQIPNIGKAGTGSLLRPGMTLAIEPMVNLGKPDIVIQPDGWTVVTKDRKPSAHYEHTVLVTEDEPEILTRIS